MTGPTNRSPTTALDARRWLYAATFSLLLLFPLVVLLTTCAQPGDSGPSSGGFGAITFQLVRPGTQSVRASGGFHTLALANAQSVVATVSGADMSPVTKTFDATPGVSGSGVIDNVPAGSNRTVTVNGYTGDNGTGTLYYQAILTGVSVAAGQTNNLGAVTIYQVAPGTLDDSFAGAGYVLSTGVARPARGLGLAVDSNGGIVVAGYSESTGSIMTLWRYNADGTPDNTFGSTSTNFRTHIGCGQPSRGQAVVIDSTGKILVAGYCTTPSSYQLAAIWRFNADGTPDTTLFNVVPMPSQPYASHTGYGYPAEARAVSVDTGGSRITIAGSSQGAGKYATIWQFYVDNWDSGFGNAQPYVITNQPGVDAQANALAVDGSGRAIVSGKSTQAAIDSMVIYRYTPGSAGTFDLFGTTLRYIADFGGGTQAVANGMLINPGGNYVIAGQVRGTFPYMTVWRFLSTSTGSPDSTFGSNGYYWFQPVGDTRTTQGNAIVRQSDGKLVVVGNRENTLSSALMVWRLLNDGSNLDTDFNGGVLAVTNSGGSTHNFDEGLAVTIDGQGRILVAGSTSDGASTTANPQMALYRVNP